MVQGKQNTQDDAGRHDGIRRPELTFKSRARSCGEVAPNLFGSGRMAALTVTALGGDSMAANATKRSFTSAGVMLGAWAAMYSSTQRSARDSGLQNAAACGRKAAQCSKRCCKTKQQVPGDVHAHCDNLLRACTKGVQASHGCESESAKTSLCMQSKLVSG